MKYKCRQCNKEFVLAAHQEKKIKQQGDCARFFCSRKCSIEWVKAKRSFSLHEKVKISIDD